MAKLSLSTCIGHCLDDEVIYRSKGEVKLVPTASKTFSESLMNCSSNVLLGIARVEVYDERNGNSRYNQNSEYNHPDPEH
jgi:hypothetical protein